MKPDLKVTTIPSEMLHWNHEAKIFTQEISSLNRYNLFERLYSDACDVGFAVKSQITGKTEIVYLSNVDKRDGDILGWTFCPLNKTLNFKIEIFND